MKGETEVIDAGKLKRGKKQPMKEDYDADGWSTFSRGGGRVAACQKSRKRKAEISGRLSFMVREKGV